MYSSHSCGFISIVIYTLESFLTPHWPNDSLVCYLSFWEIKKCRTESVCILNWRKYSCQHVWKSLLDQNKKQPIYVCYSVSLLNNNDKMVLFYILNFLIFQDEGSGKIQIVFLTLFSLSLTLSPSSAPQKKKKKEQISNTLLSSKNCRENL